MPPSFNNHTIRVILVITKVIWAIFILLSLTACHTGQEVKAQQPITYLAPSPLNEVEIEKLTANTKIAANEPDVDGVKLLSIGIDNDISFIVVSYSAPSKIADKWWQGSVYVINETTGMLYKEVPVAPMIGPLIGKPRGDGTGGYFMLNNYDLGVKSGSPVTVVLGNYKRLHVIVK